MEGHWNSETSREDSLTLTPKGQQEAGIFNGWQVWHHPNEKGSKAMFERALVDVPEVFESGE